MWQGNKKADQFESQNILSYASIQSAILPKVKAGQKIEFPCIMS